MATAVFPLVFQALAQREGQRTTLPTLQTLTGLSAQQIQMAIVNARNSSPDFAARIEVVKKGQVWKFRNVPDATNDDTVDKVMKAVEMGTAHTWKHALNVLIDSEGELLYKDELAKRVTEAGHVEMNAQQAVNAMRTILRKPKIAVNVETVWADHAWRYKSTSTPATAVTPPTSSKNATQVGVRKAPAVRALLLRYFLKHPGETLFVQDLAEALDLTDKQVKNGMYTFLHDENSTLRHDFRVVNPANAWVYAPATTPSAEPETQPTSVAPESVTTSLPAITHSLPLSLTNGQAVTVAVKEESKQTGRLFEEIGQASNGDILVQEAETKAIYRATQL